MKETKAVMMMTMIIIIIIIVSIEFSYIKVLALRRKSVTNLAQNNCTKNDRNTVELSTATVIIIIIIMQFISEVVALHNVAI